MADNNPSLDPGSNQSENDHQKTNNAEDVVRAITTAHPELLQGIPDEKKDQIAKVLSLGLSIISENTHSGPLPTVETLAGYDKIIPNGAERVMAMAEKEQTFRQEHTHYVAKSNLTKRAKGNGLLLYWL